MSGLMEMDSNIQMLSTISSANARHGMAFDYLREGEGSFHMEHLLATYIQDTQRCIVECTTIDNREPWQQSRM